MSNWIRALHHYLYCLYWLFRDISSDIIMSPIMDNLKEKSEIWYKQEKYHHYSKLTRWKGTLWRFDQIKTGLTLLLSMLVLIELLLCFYDKAPWTTRLLLSDAFHSFIANKDSCKLSLLSKCQANITIIGIVINMDLQWNKIEGNLNWDCILTDACNLI